MNGPEKGLPYRGRYFRRHKKGGKMSARSNVSPATTPCLLDTAHSAKFRGRATARRRSRSFGISVERAFSLPRLGWRQDGSPSSPIATGRASRVRTADLNIVAAATM